MPSSRRAPIFVVGCQRSGTTLLRLILDAHPNISCGPETRFLTDLAHVTTGSWKRLAQYGFPKQYWHEHIAGMFDAIKSDYARRAGKSRWADKTPRYALTLPFIDRLFPTCQVVHVIRDGRDVVASHRVRWGYLAALKAVRKWPHYVHSARPLPRAALRGPGQRAGKDPARAARLPGRALGPGGARPRPGAARRAGALPGPRLLPPAERRRGRGDLPVQGGRPPQGARPAAAPAAAGGGRQDPARAGLLVRLPIRRPAASTPGERPVELAELVSPLRYDILVRARFLARLEVAGPDLDQVVREALGGPYHTWFTTIALPRYRPREAADQRRSLAAFRERVHR